MCLFFIIKISNPVSPFLCLPSKSIYCPSRTKPNNPQHVPTVGKTGSAQGTGIVSSLQGAGNDRNGQRNKTLIQFIPIHKYFSCPPTPREQTQLTIQRKPLPCYKSSLSGIIGKPKQLHSSSFPTAVIFAIFVITGKRQQRPLGVPSHVKVGGLTLNLPQLVSYKKINRYQSVLTVDHTH